VGAAALLGLAVQQARNISVTAELCKRVRFRKSDCTRCLEICPDDAISLIPGPTVSTACSDCGLCQNVCPTEVFGDELHSEQYLLAQATSSLGAERSPNDQKSLLISCHRAGARDANSLDVACLGAITENIIVGAALSGFDQIHLMKGICSQCRLEAGEKLFQDSLSRSRALLDSLGLGEVPISLEEYGARRESTIGRKELFSKIAARVRNHAAAVRYRRNEAKTEDSSGQAERSGATYSPRRALFRQLASQEGSVSFTIKRNEPEFRWGNITVDETGCSACGICVTVCPVGALEQGMENGCRVLSFVSSACTKCSLCIEACPEEAIDYDRQWSLADLLDDDARVVARIQMTACSACGEVMPASQGRMCPTCEKREAWRCM
jgi:ferredoxin